MTYDFQRALAEILPFHMPELFRKTAKDGTLRTPCPAST